MCTLCGTPVSVLRGLERQATAAVPLLSWQSFLPARLASVAGRRKAEARPDVPDERGAEAWASHGLVDRLVAQSSHRCKAALQCLRSVALHVACRLDGRRSQRARSIMASEPGPSGCGMVGSRIESGGWMGRRSACRTVSRSRTRSSLAPSPHWPHVCAASTAATNSSLPLSAPSALRSFRSHAVRFARANFRSQLPTPCHPSSRLVPDR